MPSVASTPCAPPQVAKKVATAIYSDDLTEALEHRPWHGRLPLTLTAATLFISLHLGPRVMVPGLEPRTIVDVADICQARRRCALDSTCS
jgi:hypothetical protein